MKKKFSGIRIEKVSENINAIYYTNKDRMITCDDYASDFSGNKNEFPRIRVIYRRHSCSGKYAVHQ